MKAGEMDPGFPGAGVRMRWGGLRLTYLRNFFSGGDFRSQPEHTTSPPLIAAAGRRRALPPGAQRRPRRPMEGGRGWVGERTDGWMDGWVEGGREKGREGCGRMDGGAGGERLPPPPRPLGCERGSRKLAPSRLATPPPARRPASRVKDTNPAGRGAARPHAAPEGLPLAPVPPHTRTVPIEKLYPYCCR